MIDLEKFDGLPSLDEDMEIFTRFHIPGADEIYSKALVRKVLGNKRQAAVGIRFENIIGAGQEAVDGFVSELEKLTALN